MEKGETGMSKRKKQFVKTAKCLSKRKKVTKSPLFLSVLGVQAQGVWASRPHSLLTKVLRFSLLK